MKKVLLILLFLGTCASDNCAEKEKPSNYNNKLWCHWLSTRIVGIEKPDAIHGCFCSVNWRAAHGFSMTWVPDKYCDK